MARRSIDVEGKRDRPLTAKVTEAVFGQVAEVARLRIWSMSTATAYLVQRGLEAERKQRKNGLRKAS
jgi:hypothetical protein